MVRKRARHLFDGHVLTAGLVQNVTGRRRPGESCGNLHAGRVGAFHPVLGIEHQQDRGGEEDEIHRIEKVKKHGNLQNIARSPANG